MQLLYGEAAQLLFASQRVLPRRLTDAGLGFEHRTIEEAIADLLPR
jgi:NAD dependent epimerase/dehydratase family enzyme